MDATDKRIIEELTKNARITGAQIARKIHLSVPAVTERLRKLDKSGAIDYYTVRVNRNKLDLKLMAYIQVWLDHTKASQTKDYILRLEEVLECHHTAGDCDLLLKVLVKDTAELEELLAKKIKGNAAITKTSTTIVLSTYKEQINRETYDTKAS